MIGFLCLCAAFFAMLTLIALRVRVGSRFYRGMRRAVCAAAALAGLLTLAIALKGIGQWNTSANDPWLTIYTVLVATTAAKSLSTAIVLTGTTGGILLGAGGLLFFLSDMVLGIWNYQKPHILLADLNWLLYFAGQFMLCAGYIAAVR